MDKKSKPVKRRDILTAKQPRWREDVGEDCFISAFKYLCLFMDSELAYFVTEQLREQKDVLTIKARDLLRATELPLLSQSNAHVTHELVTIANGVKLSPILCLQGDRKRRPLIADGYYRACAAYHCDPDVEIPVRTA